MKATGIVCRVDDLGRIVIPKEIRRTLKIREGDPSHTTLTVQEQFCFAMMRFHERVYAKKTIEINHSCRLVLVLHFISCVLVITLL